MCHPASFIIVKGQPPIWSKKTESHTEIRREFGLPENTDTLIANVQVEISPTNGDLRTPLKDWVFKVDQDLLPKWWNVKEAEAAVRKELKKWHRAKVITDKTDTVEIRDCQVYVYASRVEARGSSSVVAWESSSVEAWGSSSVVARGSSSVVARGSSSVEARGSSSVVAWESSIITVYKTTDPNILKSSTAVMIDRSGGKVVCHVGSEP